MAITVDLYSTVTLVQALDKLNAFKPRQFLSKLFFAAGEDVTGEVLQIDIRKGGRRLAPFVHPKSKGRLVEKRPFDTNEIRPPYIKSLAESEAGEMLVRKFGETIYRAGKSGAQAAAEKLGEELIEHIDMIMRRIEFMAAEALRTGKLVIDGLDFDAEIDFLRDAGNDIVLTGTDLWTDAASNPLSQLLANKTIIAKATGLSADYLILGSDALDAFLENDKVQKILDNRRIQLGGGVDKLEEIDGVSVYGRIHGVTIVHYEEFYEDSTGTLVPMIDPKEAILATSAPRAKNKLHYGAIQDVEAGVVAAPFWPKSWVEQNPSSRQLMVQSAPLIALHEPDTCLRSKVLA